MSKARQRHNPTKSPEDRRRYFDTTIRPTGPTLEDSAPIIDATDISAEREGRPIGPLTPTRQTSPVHEFFKERIYEVIILSVLIPFLSWGGYMIVSLNREVGELSSSHKSTQTTQARLESEIEKTEKRITNHIGQLSSDLDRLESRIDDLIDRYLQNADRSNKEEQE